MTQTERLGQSPRRIRNKVLRISFPFGFFFVYHNKKMSCDLFLQYQYRVSLSDSRRRSILEKIVKESSIRAVYRCLRLLVTEFRVRDLPYLENLVEDEKWFIQKFKIKKKII